MPRILTQVIDTVNKEEANMNAQYGEVRHLNYHIHCNLSYMYMVLFNWNSLPPPYICRGFPTAW